MNRVIYFAMTSADGFIEDRRGSIEFHTPDAAVHEFINERHGTIRSMVLDAREGLLDEVWLMVVPVCLGAGLPVSIGEEVGLRLEESLRFENGWLFNRYAVER